MQAIIVSGIFIGAFVVIATEKVHKTVVALAAAAILLVMGFIDQKAAFFSQDVGIDFNVIFLLIGMMVIVNISMKTGLFEWLAVKAAKIAKGHPLRIMLVLTVITAALSALLDNVTTILLIAPVTIVIAKTLKTDAIPFLITEAVASNIGGAATLIGDPPNIMIASRAELTFMDFIYNLLPVILLIMAVYLISIRIIFRRNFSHSTEVRERVMKMEHEGLITDKPLLRKCLLVLALTVLGFIFHGYLEIKPAVIALSAAALLTLWARQDPWEILRQVEWPTILFFVGLFIMVGSLARTGVIEKLSHATLNLTEGNLFATSMFTLWFSAFASAIIDNIPYVATMNSMVVNMAQGMWPEQSGTALLHQAGLMPIWWSLALGACLGGNGTLIGASANVIASGIGEKHGFPISFKRFTLYGLPLMLESMLICTAYVWLRYYS
ncbi:MAG: ArsB/NhaD family transporter [Thermoleophilia bacterium]